MLIVLGKFINAVVRSCNYVIICLIGDFKSLLEYIAIFLLFYFWSSLFLFSGYYVMLVLFVTVLVVKRYGSVKR